MELSQFKKAYLPGLLLVLTWVSFTVELHANPILINYQGLLQDPTGTPLPGTYDMTFRLYVQQTGGNYDWQETHSGLNAVTVDAEGVFQVILNSTGSAAGNLATLVHDSATLWLEITVGTETLSPRQQLTSAAYALSSPWSGLTGIPSGFEDGTDDIGYPGTGLDESGGQFSIESSYQLPQNAINGQVVKWNGISMQWEPAYDNGNAYSAGDGLILTATEFSVNFAGSGSADTVARSDHNHAGATWYTSANPGFSINSSSTASSAAAIRGMATGNTNATGVHGETSSSVSASSGIKGLANGGSGAVSGVYGETNSPSSGACGVAGIATGGGFSANGVFGETNASQGAGVYGKNTLSSGFGLYSQGNAKIDGTLTVTENLTISGDIINNPVKTGYITVTYVAFHPEKFDVEYEKTDGYYKRLNGSPSLDDEKEALADIQLPHGSTLTKVTFYGYTDSPMSPDTATEFEFTMYRTSLDGSQDTMVSYSDNDQPAVPQLSSFSYESAAISHASIDNETYGYYVKIAHHLGLRVFGVQFEYTW